VILVLLSRVRRAVAVFAETEGRQLSYGLKVMTRAVAIEHAGHPMQH
jgi:hypothetical protein